VAQNLVGGLAEIKSGSVALVDESRTYVKDQGVFLQEEVLTLGEKLLLTAGLRADRSSNNADPRITYATPKKCQTYSVENIDEHRQALFQIALKIEKYLALSNDPEFFKSITVPDLDSYYWDSPVARQLAWEHFGI